MELPRTAFRNCPPICTPTIPKQQTCIDSILHHAIGFENHFFLRTAKNRRAHTGNTGTFCPPMIRMPLIRPSTHTSDWCRRRARASPFVSANVPLAGAGSKPAGDRLRKSPCFQQPAAAVLR
jgi:hypothetical protein